MIHSLSEVLCWSNKIMKHTMIQIFLFVILVIFMRLIIPNAEQRKRRKIRNNIYAQLKHNSLINVKNSKGDSFLHIAIYYRDLKLFQMLLDHNADISLGDSGGRTPLIYASLFDHHEMVKLLLARGADPNEKDSSGDTSLHWAGMNGCRESARLLLENGADVHAVNNDLCQPLHCAVNYSNTDLIALFVTHGANLNLTTKHDKSLLWLTASKDDCHAIKTLIDHGAVMSVTELNECMIQHARYRCNAHVLRVLIEYADDNYRYSPDLRYPLHEAVVSLRDIDVVSLLVERGAAIDPVIAKIAKESGVMLSYNVTDTPLRIATELVRQFKIAVEKKERKARLKRFVEQDLMNVLLIAAQVLFILIPTLYLCVKSSWGYCLVPGIPITIIGLFLWSVSKTPSATGDAQGAVIIYFIFVPDALLMLGMTAMAFHRFFWG